MENNYRKGENKYSLENMARRAVKGISIALTVGAISYYTLKPLFSDGIKQDYIRTADEYIIYNKNQ